MLKFLSRVCVLFLMGVPVSQATVFNDLLQAGAEFTFEFQSITVDHGLDVTSTFQEVRVLCIEVSEDRHLTSSRTPGKHSRFDLRTPLLASLTSIVPRLRYSEHNDEPYIALDFHDWKMIAEFFSSYRRITMKKAGDWVIVSGETLKFPLFGRSYPGIRLLGSAATGEDALIFSARASYRKDLEWKLLTAQISASEDAAYILQQMSKVDDLYLILPTLLCKNAAAVEDLSRQSLSSGRDEVLIAAAKTYAQDIQKCYQTEGYHLPLDDLNTGLL